MKLFGIMLTMNDSLGDRMKGYYEARSKTSLIRRMPVIIRLDGKAFHTFTRGFVKPFDRMLMTAMQRTMEYLCSNIQGCVLGYTQSDEIMPFTEKGINWNDFPTDCKRGSCCIRYEGKWVIDKEIPIFKGGDRDYIENLINYESVEESTPSCQS